jgi:hypothetical protein
MARSCLILADAPGALVELCGISVLERLLRMLQRAGIMEAAVLSRTPAPISAHLEKPSWARDQMRIAVHECPSGVLSVENIFTFWPNNAAFLLVIRGDYVFDYRLLQIFALQKTAAVLTDSAAPGNIPWCGMALLERDWARTQVGTFEENLRSGIPIVDVEALPLYWQSLRRKLRPFWFPAPTSAEQKNEAERILLDSVQKQTQDLPAYVHAPIEGFLLSHLWGTSTRPNHITAASVSAAFAVTVLFATGHLISGIVLALIVGVLDGVDGKLARLKVETTPAGRIDHFVDNFVEVGWPGALAYHFYASGQLPSALIYYAVFFVADVLDGLGKLGIYSAAEKSSSEPAAFDRIVRLFGGRRNIYIWVLIVCLFLRVPEKSIVIMAWWEGITAAFDVPHAIWAQLRLRRQKPIG